MATRPGAIHFRIDIIEQRGSDIDGLVPPTWQRMQARHYAHCLRPHLVIDTALLTPQQAVVLVERHLQATTQD